jgi:hypothetical protein
VDRSSGIAQRVLRAWCASVASAVCGNRNRHARAPPTGATARFAPERPRRDSSAHGGVIRKIHSPCRKKLVLFARRDGENAACRKEYVAKRSFFLARLRLCCHWKTARKASLMSSTVPAQTGPPFDPSCLLQTPTVFRSAGTLRSDTLCWERSALGLRYPRPCGLRLHVYLRHDFW